MAVTRDDVRAIAGLARLSVADDRVDALAGELNGILAHMDVLARVEGRDVADAADAVRRGMELAPDAGPPVQLARLPDTIAPAWREGFFLVPRLATHGDADGGEMGGS